MTSVIFTLGCEEIFTNEDRGGDSDGPPQDDDDDDDTDDDTDDDADDDTDDDISEVSAALIYDHITTIPGSFEDWGSDYYVDIDSYKTLDADDADLSIYDVIILAEDVDVYQTLYNHIHDSGKPIVALFEGNSYFNMEGTHWYRYYVPDSCLIFDLYRNVYLLNTTDIVFNSPWPIDIPSGNVLQLTLTQKSANACDNFYMPDYVIAVGAIPDFEAYVAIGYETNTKIVFWGFEGRPSELTDEGQKLLANLVHYAASKM